jgi:hypothetical protein
MAKAQKKKKKKKRDEFKLSSRSQEHDGISKERTQEKTLD